MQYMYCNTKCRLCSPLAKGYVPPCICHQIDVGLYCHQKDVGPCSYMVLVLSFFTRCNDDFLVRNNLSLSLNLTSDDFMNTSGTHSYLIKNGTSFSNYVNGTSLQTTVDPATEFWR